MKFVSRELEEIAMITKNIQLKEDILSLNRQIKIKIKVIQLEQIIDDKNYQYPFVKEIEDLKYNESIDRTSILKHEAYNFYYALSDFKSKLDLDYMKI